MQYIFDADWVINALAGKRNAAELTKELGPAGIAISIITVGEVYEGAFAYPHPEAHLASFRRFFDPFDVVEITEPIMKRFAKTRAALHRQGNLIPDFDLVIAATALHLDLIVLTFNVRHFERIPDLKIYRRT